MLMEDFFEAVDRALIQGAGRNPAPRRPEPKAPVKLSLSAPESSPATSSSERCRQPGRCRQPDGRYNGSTPRWGTIVTHKTTPHSRRQGEQPMNKDQVSGKVEQAVGKVEKTVGETVGNEKLANRGVADQAKGAAKETWGHAKDAVKEVQQSHKDAATDKAHETRGQISQSVLDAKEKVNEKIDKFKNSRSVIQPDALRPLEFLRATT